MKNNYLIPFVALLFWAIASSQAQEDPQWVHEGGPHFIPHHPFLFPFHHPFPFPFHHPPAAPKTTSPKVVDEEKRCYLAVHSPAMRACLGDLHSYIMTHKIKVCPTCCSALEKIVDVCQPLVDHPFTFVENIISHHCSAPSPSYY